ncbi:hypothetical protein BCR34DRAFT_596196 [Clohesyomyces aquaticus]|uniref:Uncharacterized protein n=1 Tax=Clohesyomyces aquaticus TaxID=1231657 RepID=A0A1Y2A8J1_9PLEO|nr:hypothetical protein BCR34DRAFT_596196 [Clohesyomyces aquaticus]
MPIRKAEKKAPVLAPGVVHRTGDYSRVFSPPQQYKPIQPQVTIQSGFSTAGIPQISTRDLNYFFNAAGSLYSEDVAPNAYATMLPPSQAPPEYNDTTPAYSASAAPPGYAEDFSTTALDPSAILVLRLFRQTRIDVRPIAERFHLGPADRQPLYSLTAQPSVRSGTEYNELVIKRRDPIHGVWYHTCTSDIEPSLELAKPGNWTVAKLVLESMPVWKKMVGYQVQAQQTVSGKGNALQLTWGDRATLGPLGDAYGLWWGNGNEGGDAEAFYVVEGWRGFDCHPQGIVRVKAAAKDAQGRYQDPRLTPGDLATIYFHADGKSPPQFVCAGVEAHVRMDVIMAGLMTVLVVETRKVSVQKEMGALPAYDSGAHWSSPLVQEGLDLGDAWGS